jgi:hypothetical protein
MNFSTSRIALDIIKEEMNFSTSLTAIDIIKEEEVKAERGGLINEMPFPHNDRNGAAQYLSQVDR